MTILAAYLSNPSQYIVELVALAFVIGIAYLIIRTVQKPKRRRRYDFSGLKR